MDRMDKLAVSAHLRLFCLTKWMVSYKGQEWSRELLRRQREISPVSPWIYRGSHWLNRASASTATGRCRRRYMNASPWKCFRTSRPRRTGTLFQTGPQRACRAFWAKRGTFDMLVSESSFGLLAFVA